MTCFHIQTEGNTSSVAIVAMAKIHPMEWNNRRSTVYTKNKYGCVWGVCGVVFGGGGGVLSCTVNVQGQWWSNIFKSC